MQLELLVETGSEAHWKVPNTSTLLKAHQDAYTCWLGLLEKNPLPDDGPVQAVKCGLDWLLTATFDKHMQLVEEEQPGDE